MLAVDDLIDDYNSSLIEPDEARRVEILERVWADDCEVILPELCVQGRAAINRHITNIRQMFRNSTPMIVGPVDAHNGYIRFEWRVVDPSGEFVAVGVNFAEQDSDGRLRRVVLFRGVRPGQYL